MPEYIYKLVNSQDGNDHHELESKDDTSAALEALEMLGYDLLISERSA